MGSESSASGGENFGRNEVLTLDQSLLYDRRLHGQFLLIGEHHHVRLARKTEFFGFGAYALITARHSPGSKDAKLTGTHCTHFENQR